jgi:hypothetical protein
MATYLFFLFPYIPSVLVYIHVCVWVYSRGHSIPPGILNFSADGWITCGGRAVFPSHKGRKYQIYVFQFSIFDYLVASIVNHDMVRLFLS